MFPILVVMYRRLARAEERDVHKMFGRQWEEYAARAPAFIPRLGSVAHASGPPEEKRA